MMMNVTIFLAATCVMLGVLLYDTLRFQHRRKESLKHDQVLFPFCQLRRDIMRFLHENVFEKPGALSPDEYTAVRRLSDALDGAISNYNRHKTLMFNVRKMSNHLKVYERASQTTLQLPDHPQIRAFYERAGRLLIKAFLAYTPLIRWELALKLVIAAYRAWSKEGQHRAAAEYVASHAGKIRDDARRYGVSMGYT